MRVARRSPPPPLTLRIRPSMQITVTGATGLVEAPQWLATNASLSGTSECPGLPAVVIHTQADYQAFVGNAALSAATELGQVIITWGAITDIQMATVFQDKTTLGGLVIEGCRAITSLSPALDNVTTITSGLVLDNLRSLASAEMLALSFVGGGVRIYNNAALVSVRAPLATTVGSLFVYNCGRLRRTTFNLLTSINGTFSLSQLQYLSATAITNGFPWLQTVQGTFSLNNPGYRLPRNTIRAPLSLPQLRTIGGWYARNVRVSSVSLPALTSVGGLAGQSGTFYWNSLPYLRAIHVPSLSVVTGRISIISTPGLTTLCHMGNLQESGYQTSSSVSGIPPATLDHDLVLPPRPRPLSTHSRMVVFSGSTDSGPEFGDSSVVDDVERVSQRSRRLQRIARRGDFEPGRL